MKKKKLREERWIPPVLPANFPTGDFLGAAFLILQIGMEEKKEKLHLSNVTNG